jgi:toxin ParE1/3/4
MKILWTNNAKVNLTNIRKNHSKHIASKINSRTKDFFPLMGQKEDFLFDYKADFRYLVEGNYKIIYWINGEVIRISSVFDTRQNPEKLKNLD